MEKTADTLEFAREAHERWLMKNNRQDLEKAIEYYSKVLTTNPSHPETHYHLAMLLWESGQISLSTAIEKCRYAVEVSPNNVNARLYTGYFLKIADKCSEAEREFKKAISINPITSSRPRMNIGLMHSEKLLHGEFTFDHFIKSLYYLSTGILTGIFDYSCINMAIKKIKDKTIVGGFLAAGNILKLLGLEKTEFRAYKGGSIKTKHPEIFNKIIGDININKENIDEALDSYEKVLEARPYDRETLLKKATILQTYKEDKIYEAINAYTLALETEGSKEYIYYELGHLYMKANDIINSVNAFKMAIEEDNTNPYFHNALGFAYFKAGQYEEAEDHYLLAIGLNPDSEWTATVCRATALIYADIKKRPDKAIQMYKQSISLDANCAETYSALGDLYFDEEDYELAMENYSKSLALNPNDAYVYSKFATSLWQKEMVEESIIAFKNAIDSDDTYAPAYNNLGVVYLDGKNDIFAAKDAFKEAIKTQPDYVMAHFNLGRVYEKFDNKVKAAQCYAKALSLNKENPETDNELIEESIQKLFEV